MRLAVHTTLAFALLAAPQAFAQSTTAQRLDLLERRVSRITDLTLELETLRRENRELRGETERLGHEIEQLKRQQRDLYLDIDQRLGALTGEGATPSSASPGVVATPSAAVDRGAIEAEYQAAYRLLDPAEKRYDEAAEAFTKFLQQHPNDPLAANAQYWLGEAHYVAQQNDAALAAFEAVIANYPDSAKAPGALFKIGRLQEAAGKREAARASYRRVLAEYPDASAAGLARQHLDRLGG
jgi:tol-pal system protein YbgF